MPYNNQGEWVAPEGFEEFDQEGMFQESQTSLPGLIGNIIEGYSNFDEFQTASLSNILTGNTEVFDTMSDVYQYISEYTTPFDMSEISNLKRDAQEERSKITESMYAESMKARSLAGQSGFASSLAGNMRQNDLWSEYTNKNKELTERLKTGISQAKGDYLDNLFIEIAETYNLLLGDN